jgi:hypothetical protein
MASWSQEFKVRIQQNDMMQQNTTKGTRMEQLDLSQTICIQKAAILQAG